MPTKTNTAKRGRKPDANSKSGQIRTLLVEGMATADIAKKVGCTPALIYQVKAKAGGKKPARKGKPGRKPKLIASAGGSDGLAAILDAVKNSERERVQLRSALERIHAVVQAALA